MDVLRYFFSLQRSPRDKQLKEAAEKTATSVLDFLFERKTQVSFLAGKELLLLANYSVDGMGKRLDEVA